MVKIREYKPADFEKLYEIDQAAFEPGIAYSHLELQFYLRNRASRTLIAEDRGEVVGFVIGKSEARRLGHIITIDVAPHRQRQAVGSRLLAQIEAWLWGRGAEVIYLETPVDDKGAQEFYEKHGYFILERIENYYNDSLDGFVMMKTVKR